MSKQKIIFLDFDVVMDTQKHFNVIEGQGLRICDKYGSIFDPACVENLKQIIDETHAVIVVASSWKYFMSIQELKDMWQERQLPVVSMTPFDPRSRRGYEIDAWLDLQEEKPDYVIIDDMAQDQFNEDQTVHLAIAHPRDGLDEAMAKKAIEILNEKS